MADLPKPQGEPISHSDLTIGQLLRTMKVTHLWVTLGAIVTLIGGGFYGGYWLGSSFAKANADTNVTQAEGRVQNITRQLEEEKKACNGRVTQETADCKDKLERTEFARKAIQAALTSALERQTVYEARQKQKDEHIGLLEKRCQLLQDALYKFNPARNLQNADWADWAVQTASAADGVLGEMNDLRVRAERQVPIVVFPNLGANIRRDQQVMADWRDFSRQLQSDAALRQRLCR